MANDIKTALERATQVCGGKAALARLMTPPVTPQAIQIWFSLGRPPAERVLRIEEVTGIPRHELRPDIYPANNKNNSGAP